MCVAKRSCARAGCRLITFGNSGSWLIRESARKARDYVLSVNWNGVPRHIKMDMLQGDCRIANMTFPGHREMVLHFQANSFPEANELSDTIKLTEFVSNDPIAREANIRHRSTTGRATLLALDALSAQHSYYTESAGPAEAVGGSDLEASLVAQLQLPGPGAARAASGAAAVTTAARRPSLLAPSCPIETGAVANDYQDV